MNKHLIERAKTYPNFKYCSIQTFNEQDKEEKSQSRIMKMSRENLEWCERLQETQPYWVYFSVNPMEEGKRNKESVKAIITWICDIDEWTKEEQLELIKNAPLPPSLVVESVHGFHLYYLADKELTEEEYCNGNRWLRNYYHGDPKVCKDTARVLRIPGFYHQKGEKVMVEYRDDLSVKFAYSVEYMNEAFPNQVENMPWTEKQRKQLNTYLNEWDDFWSKASELDSRMMLEEFSWTGRVNGDRITFKKNSWGTEQIYVNGKSTWCWIDRNWLIGSWDKWWPTRIQWLKWYWLVDWRELAKDLKKNHPELEEKKKEAVVLDLESLMKKPSAAPELKSPDFTWWDTWLDNAVWKLSRGQMVILTWETWAWKTTFATFIARKNKNSCYFVLEDSLENIARRYALKRAWITKQELNEGTWWDYKQELYERAYMNFTNKDVRFVNIWHKLDVDTLINSMRQLKEKWHWLFFIDNLGFIIWAWISEAEQTADISSKLVSFCLKENVCVVLLHHFKKWDKTQRRDISQMRWSWKLGDDAFFVANYDRQDEWTLLQIFKDRNRWELETYLLEYDKGDFKYKGVYS